MNSTRDHAEAAVLRELSHTWGSLNRQRFAGRLRPPVIELGDGSQQVGRWEPSSRTIRLSRRLVMRHPWGVVVEVLKHEMAHQFVSEVLGVTGEAPHGPSFREVCERAGIDPTPRGLPDAPPTPEPKVVRRIRRLLALADSPNEHEAQAAMNAAHRLMLKHNIALVEAQARTDYGFRQIGRPKLRIQAYEKVLAGILTQHFFVRGIWANAWDVRAGKPGRVLEIMGTTDNLDIAEWVHGYLLETAERCWARHKQAAGIRGDRDRRRFLSGVMYGFSDKLRDQSAACREEGLVWVGDATLDSYFADRHPDTVRARAMQMTVSGAWFAGREAGRQIVLRRPVRQDTTARNRKLTVGESG